MKVENMVKLKEEFDYKSLCRRLDIELDKLLAENERQRKDFEDEIERIRTEADSRVAEVEKGYKANQDKIVEAGGLTSLLMLLRNSEDETIRRVAAGAIANLAMNDKLQMKLSVEGGIKALLGMVRCGHPDVLAQVARGIANFAKCESRASTQGNKVGVSLLIEDGALPWIVKNANHDASPIRRHIELALCHLAQHGNFA
ncbi:hypothetical protein GW17_00042983 [Ensete ventricosum]|nr:hypothetical protein GW17_00042983 [Ensete ventricosum]